MRYAICASLNPSRFASSVVAAPASILLPHLDDLDDPVEEPRVDPRWPRRPPRRSRRARSAASTWKIRSGVGTRDLLEQLVDVGREVALARVAVQPVRPGSSERIPFCSASPKVRPIAIASPIDCIFVPSCGGTGELLEREPRDLHDDVVDRRLEARRRLAA